MKLEKAVLATPLLLLLFWLPASIQYSWPLGYEKAQQLGLSSSGLFFAHLCNIALGVFCFFLSRGSHNTHSPHPPAPFDVSAGSLPLRKNSPGSYRPIIIIGAAVRHCANVFHWDLGPPLLHSLSALWSSSSFGHLFLFSFNNAISMYMPSRREVEHT